MAKWYGRSVLAVLVANAIGIQILCAQTDSPAAKYPARAIRFIVPFPPGAANDLIARAVGQRLAERLAQPVVIDNRGGGGGTLGTALAARAAPDGYTIVLVPATHAINVTLYAKPPYDAVKDFAPVALIATGPYLLAVNPALPARTVKELIALAKSRPGQFNYGSAGTGNATHLIGELMKSMAGIDISHIPYKGTSLALTDVIAGQIHMMFGTISATNPQIKAGRVRALAVTSARRSAAAQEVPTMDEAGIPGFDAVGWWGVLAPAATPPTIIGKLNSEIGSIVAAEDMQRWLQSQGFDPAISKPGHFADYIRAEIVKWGKVVKASDVQPE